MYVYIVGHRITLVVDNANDTIKVLSFRQQQYEYNLKILCIINCGAVDCSKYFTCIN